VTAKTKPTPEDLIQRVPPHSVEAEVSILGGIFCDPKALDVACEYVTPEDFYLARHRVLFAAMLELHEERREPIDLVVLTDLLRESGKLEELGGATALSEMANAVPTAAHVGSYATIVRTKAIQRQVIDASLKTALRAYEPVANAAEFLAEAEMRIASIAAQHVTPAASTADDTATATLRRLDGKDAERVPTGYPTLDRDLGGFLRGSLVVGARPGTGKSIFASDLALRGAIPAGVPVLHHSLEMSREELMLRVLANRCSIPNWRLQRGMLHATDRTSVATEVKKLATLPWFIRDGAAPWTQDLRAYERVVRDHQVGVLIVDHVGLIRGVERSFSMRRDLVIGEITAGLVAFARRHRVVVVLISQLNRASQQENREPELHDLRDSGSLEQDASVVIFLHAPDKQEQSGDTQQRLDVIVAKNRQGPTGTFTLSYLKQFCRIIDSGAEEHAPDEIRAARRRTR
jgi:replicative DNA helicase